MAAMNTAIRLARVTGLAAALWLGSAEAQEAGRWDTLEAIHQIENPHDSARPGKFGELGAYQFRETTWRMHTAEPFARALDRKVSDEVAVLHYEWLRRGLERNGLPVTTYNVALAWNAGLGAVVRGRVPASTHRYAERARNLAEDMGRRRLVAGR